MVKFIAALILSTTFAHAQFCLTDAECASQLMRVQVAPGVLAQSGGNTSLEFLNPMLQQLADSDFLRDQLRQPFTLTPLHVPHFREVCERRQAQQDPNYRNLNCRAESLCADKSMPAVVRTELCFNFPCSLLEGQLQVGACGDVSAIYPGQISFPNPLQIRDVQTSNERISLENGRVRLCLTMDSFDAAIDISVGLQTEGTTLADRGIQLRNVNPRLDGPRNVCISARVNLASNNVLEDIQFDVEGGTFTSDAMLRDMAQRMSLSGLAGYDPQQVELIKQEVMPAVMHPIRSSIETGVKEALAKTLQDQVAQGAAYLRQAQGDQALRVDAQSFISEIGVKNMMVQNPLAVLECATISETGGQIPANHACIGLPAPSFSEGGTPVDEYSSTINQNTRMRYFFALSDLRRAIDNYDGTSNVTSDNVKSRLERIRNMLIAANNGRETYDSQQISGMIRLIEEAQARANIPRFLELQTRVGQGMTGVGVAMEEICDANRPSAHLNRSMPGCPIQVYADLNDMNRLLRRMWENGQMCERGRGPFVPERDAQGQVVRNGIGQPRGTGCYINAGLGCYLDEPPQLTYNATTRRYQTRIRMKSCYHNGFFGILAFGSDLNIDYSFQPRACHNGDFCAENPRVSSTLVPGTGRGALSGGWISDKIGEAIRDGVREGLGSAIRLPLASATGVLGSVPLRAQGRVDVGAGYFGACLEVDPNN
jgi:hypothetical protein